MKRIFSLFLIISMVFSLISGAGISANQLEPENENALVESVQLEPEPQDSEIVEPTNPIDVPDVMDENRIENEPTERYMVRYKTDLQARSTVASSMSMDIMAFEEPINNELDLVGSYILELTQTEYNQLLEDGNVEHIEKDQMIELTNMAQENVNDEVIATNTQIIPWGIYATGAYLSNAVSANGNSVKVAVFDTGIADHPELRLAGGVSFVESNLSYLDEFGHGTQVAGPIAAIDDDKGISGSTNNAELYSVKVIDAEGTGYVSAVIQGLEWAVENGIQIINLSFVVKNHSELLQEAIQLARANGILIIAASGNTGLGESNVQYPGAYPEVLAVGAVDKSHTRASFSSTGAGLNMVAPGSDILTTNQYGGYSVTSGTSIAAAHVTGAAALLWSQMSALTNDEIISLLLNTSTVLGDSSEYGNGLINVAKALGHTSEAISPIENNPTKGDFNVWIPELEGELAIASYDQTGNGQIVTAGNSARVSVKLNGNQNGENKHEKIVVTVYPSQSPESVIRTDEILNPVLHERIPYTWNVEENILPGAYTIRFHYPARPTGEDDDYFKIFVQQPGLAPPTNLIAVPSANSIKLSWTAPVNAISFKVMLNGTFVEQTTESVYVFDHLNAMTPYRLSVAAIYPEDKSSNYVEVTSTTTLDELIVYSPIVVDQELSEKKFLFRPASNGIYRIVTSQNPASSLSSDTELKLFADPGMTQLIASNDDFGGTAFSEIKQSLEGGKDYYVLLSSFGQSHLSAQINAEVISSDVPYIKENEAVDINEKTGSSTIYVFVPPTSAKYDISTNYFQGVSRNGENDTQISLYSDINLTVPVPDGFNDDTESSVFSFLSMSLTAGTPYYVKISGFDDSQVLARLLVTKPLVTPVVIENKSSQLINKSAGEYELFEFTPRVTGNYSLFTSPGQAKDQVVDTEIILYGDARLTSRIASNDDVKGTKPYGALFSRIDSQLTAGKSYYVMVKNLESIQQWSARFMIEDNFHGTRETAQLIKWDDLIEADSNGATLSVSSLYNTDYFKLILQESHQVSFTIEKATGYIEDKDGNVLVYIDSWEDTVFDFIPGEYYVRIKHDVLGKTSYVSGSSFNEYEYSFGAYINIIDYGIETSGEVSILSANGMEKSMESFDATPESKGVALKYLNKIDTSELVFDVYAMMKGIVVYSGNLKNQSINNLSTIQWKGEISHSTDIFANEASVTVYPAGYNYKKYYAKDGTYQIIVYPKGKKKYQISYTVKVNNNPLNKYNWIPIPPQKFKNGIVINGSNKDKCGECRNYFYRYVVKIDSSTPVETAYQSWLTEMYGQSGLQKFWSQADKLVYDPNASILDNIQMTLDKIGLIPVFGMPADGINGVVYLMRGKYTDALLSAAAMIPVAEIAANGKKIYGLKKYVSVYAKSPCNCFTEDTLIATDIGKKKIAEIQIGDLVLAKNEETGDIAYKPVEYVFSKPTDELYIIKAGGTTIKTTDNHPFWIKERGWVIAKDLAIGDELETSSSQLIPIENISIERQTTTVYNFTVADYHTYFSTELEIFTHNVVCYIYDISKLNNKVIGNYNKGVSNSTILGEQLAISLYLKPAIEGDITNWAAHHIVPATAKYKSAKAARDLITKYGIDFNSSANGVWLPMKKGQKQIDIIDEDTQIIFTYATHNGSHARRYYDYVYDRIKVYDNLPNATDLIKHELNQIRLDLSKGVTHLGKI